MGRRTGWVSALACAISLALLSTMPFIGEAWAAGAELIEDGGFEAGAFGEVWTESSEAYGTPICDDSFCPEPPSSGPRTGTNWAWFGGTASETAVVAQNVTIPTGDARLSFWIEIPECSDASPGTFTAEIDGIPLFTTDEGADACGQPGYAAETMDVSAYADGAEHSVSFVGEFPPGDENEWTSFFLDDVSLVVNQPPALAPIGDKTAYEGQPLTFTISATDPDPPDTFLFSATPLPGGASLDEDTGAFSWTPSDGQAGDHAVEFEVTDGEASDSEAITITVNDTDPTSTTLSTKKTAKKIKAKGTVTPAQSGTMTVTLSRKRQGVFRPVKTLTPTLDATSAYAAAFKRPRPGSCMVQATFPGDADSGASTFVKTLRC